MTNGRPSILSAVLPAMLVALVGVLVLAIAADIIRSIRHRDTVSEVQSAGLQPRPRHNPRTRRPRAASSPKSPAPLAISPLRTARRSSMSRA